MGTDIPLWIGGLKKWVTGVTKQTTCEDIIRAVLAANEASNHHHHKRHSRDPKRYVIVERWQKVERSLDPRTKLLKVWNTWGLEQCNVRFLLKRAHHASTSTPRDVKSHRRKVSSKSSRTWHPRKLRSESEDDGSCFNEYGCGCEYDGEEAGFPATEEQLRNLVAAQTEALTAQLHRLKRKDEEIESIESEIHAQRMRQIGANYVLDTYMIENVDEVADATKTSCKTPDHHHHHEVDASKTSCKTPGHHYHELDATKTSCKTPDHHHHELDATKTSCKTPDHHLDVDASVSSSAVDIIDHCIELYEKVLQICDQVHREEVTIQELTSRIQQVVRLKDTADECRLLDDNPELAFAGPERLEEILNRTRNDIERLLRINQTQQQTIQQNEHTLLDCTKIIEDKHYYLQHLKSDLDRLDRDNLRLQEEFQAVQVVAMDRIGSCDVPENGDSNSDTGLSSMHSSDDGATVLDTLV